MVFAQFWVDTGHPGDALDHFAEQLVGRGFTVEDLESIGAREVCDELAISRVHVVLSAGMAMALGVPRRGGAQAGR